MCRLVLASVPLVLFLAACAAPAPQVEATPPPDTGAVSDMWSREGVEAQPRMLRLQQEMPPEMGWNPGTIPWRRAPLELPPRLTGAAAARFTTPGALLHEVMGLLDSIDALGVDIWEQTTRVWMDEEAGRAIGVILHWGMKDDAEAGFDVRVHMQLRNGRWSVEFVEERSHCARDVTAEGLCV